MDQFRRHEINAKEALAGQAALTDCMYQLEYPQTPEHILTYICP